MINGQISKKEGAEKLSKNEETQVRLKLTKGSRMTKDGKSLSKRE
jgi:hypothetical protein